MHSSIPESGNTDPAPTESPAKPPGKFQFDQSAIDSSTAEGFLTETGINKSEGVKKPPVSAVHVNLDDIGDDEKISDDISIDDDVNNDDEPEPASKLPATGPLRIPGVDEDDFSSLFSGPGDQKASDSDNIDSLLSGNFKDLGDTAMLPAVDTTLPSDESWAKEILAEIEKEKVDKPEDINLQEVTDIHDILTDFTNPVDVDAARRDLGFEDDDPFASRELGEKTSVAAAVAERAELIAHIEPPPVEFLYDPARRRDEWIAFAKWGAAALFLALLLPVQHVAFNFDRLAKDVSARPYLRAMCHVVRCKLPPVENWRYIKVSNLVMRKHPDVPDGLVLDAILFNVTKEEQPFPKLELYFSDLAKTPIASRRFEPSEYLSGEMLGKKVIPPGRPIHVALEIVNPGEKAVNWTLQVAGKTD